MGEKTGINWCEHTFNLWFGCEHAERTAGSTDTAPECDHCYAQTFDHRLGGDHWGPGAPARFFGPKYWAKPFAWNAAAEKAGVRARVFCSSMADWAQLHRDPEIAARQASELLRLWQLIRATPWLDWMMLTKRIDRAGSILPWASRPDDEIELDHERVWNRRGFPLSEPWPNLWLGTTCGHTSSLWRIDALRRTPATVRFVSCEPMLDRISEAQWDIALRPTDGIGDIHQLIVGDESGHGRRPARVEWVETARDAALRHGVAFHFKQWNGNELGGDGKKTVHLPVIGGRTWSERPTAGIPILQQDPVDPDHYP